jgi:hypothetical protein
MSHRNHLFAALLLGALLVAVRASAGEPLSDSTAAATNQPALSVSLRGGETVRGHQVERAYLSVGTNEIVFIVPTSFRMDASDPQKILLTDNTGGCFITVRISGAPHPDAAAQSDFFKAEALSRFPGAKISSQSSEFAANHSGPAFNLEWDGSSGSEQSVRIVFVPCAAGILEFSVLARTVDFKDAQTYLSLLINSVRSNETGKIVIIPEPDFS